MAVDALDGPGTTPIADEDKPKPPAGPVESFQYKDIAPVFRDHVARYGEELVALPYGGSVLVIVYRQDAFRRDANQKAAKEAGLGSQPPQSWKDFEALARFFQKRDWDGDGSIDFGVALALGEDTDGLASSTFLARAIGPGLHRDYYSFLFDTDSMAPRLQSPPFVEALESLVSLRDSGRRAWRSSMPRLPVKRFIRATLPCSSIVPNGQRPGHMVSLLDPAFFLIKPGLCPGPEDLGRNLHSEQPVLSADRWRAAIGVRSGLEGPKLEAAIDFARFLADPENSNRIRSERRFAMLPFRIGQMQQGLPDPTSAPDVDVRLWSDAVSRTLLAARVVPGLRIPEAGGYLDDLTKGRLAALKGESAEKTLAAVAEA